jgi:predicted RNA-binding Zn-ribbon protein involved in translation (DUF1610 family)
MNVYEKLQKMREAISKIKLTKSGYNDYSNFSYYELSDFMDHIINQMNEKKVTSSFNMKNETTILTLINIETPEETIQFECPTSSAKLKACHEVQNLGAVITYTRRYLLMLAFDIVDKDQLDSSIDIVDKDQLDRSNYTDTEPQKPQAVPSSSKYKNELTVGKWCGYTEWPDSPFDEGAFLAENRKCPKCGEALVVRHVKKNGNPFIACPAKINDAKVIPIEPYPDEDVPF